LATGVHYKRLDIPGMERLEAPSVYYAATESEAQLCRGDPVTGSSGNGYRSMLETGRAGVFAVGDVRSGSVKRVASAVGEGAIAVRLVHEFLDTIERR